MIIERFEETKGIDLKKCWIERVAWVFSWVAAIPAGGFNKEAMMALSILEEQFRGTSLEGQFVESAQDHISLEKQGEVLLNSQDESVLVPMKQFIILADQIIHLNGSWNTTLSTTNKAITFYFSKSVSHL